ncbi:hypothetical protein L6164_006529 [Bauhinia variegata]|uniref:Uncharacterized protein n=1 Tax=Bauhinia variegata TaxID=167791 RepID=A0ACB9PV93_BAUVA|nr:hypothetical protein L6164_006529 [Bauhinia variegata]
MMFTPQKWSGWSLTPKSRTGSGSNPNVGADGTTVEGKSVAFLEAKTPGSGSALNNGGNMLIGSGEGDVDQELLVKRLASIEKELYDYQYNMGLLLIEKKDWDSRYEKLSQDFAEAKDALEQEKAAHLIAISEVEEREENLRKALGVEKECVLDLEKSLREMRSEHAKVKFTADSKLAEANALVASVEEKSLEVEAKLRAADAKLAELSRKNSETDRKSHDLEAQEAVLRRDRLSFIADREAHESNLSKQREDLREWEKKLHEGEERLAKGQKILNEREQKANENDQLVRDKEKGLEEVQKNIEAAHVTLRNKEDDINSRLADINLKEKEYDAMKMNLDLKEKELSAWEEKLIARENAEIQKLLDEHNAILDVKKKEFEVELDEKRKSFEDGLKNRLVDVEKKEAEINHMEEKLGKREQALEKKKDKLKEKEKELELKSKALKEREKSIKSEEKNLEKEKGQNESEREKLLSLKAEVEKIRATNEEELLKIREETNQLKVTEVERSDYVRLQSELKHEIEQYRVQKEQLLKEADDLMQQKEAFEREWDELDLKRAAVETELKDVNEQKEEISRLKQFEEEKLKNEKRTTQDYVQRELEALKLAKESFASQMEVEKSDLAEKVQSERNQMLLDFEVRKRELEADIQNQLEQKEKDLLERRKSFEEERERELDNINYLREVAGREMEEMKLQRKKLEKEKQEADEDKKHLESQRFEMRKDIEELVDLNRKFKDQRLQFVEERQRFIEFVEKLRDCQNCGEIISEFVLSDLQFLDKIENAEVPSLPKLADDFLQERNMALGQKNNLSPAIDSQSPGSGGKMSWLQKCTKIFRFSPGTKIESENIKSLRDGATSSNENAKIETSPRISENENEAELSFAIVSDSFDVRRVQSENNFRDVEADQDPSADDQSNIDSKAPEPEAPEYSQPSDLKDGQQKYRKGRGRSRITRTRTIKAAVKDAKAILDEPVDGETQYPNGDAGDSANMNSESPGQPSKRLPNVRKRNHVQTSQITTSEHGDTTEGHSDSEITGKCKRRRQKAAPSLQTAGEARYNLRRPKVGAPAASARTLPGGRKKIEGQVDRIKHTEDGSHTNENGASTQNVQSDKIVEVHDGYGDTTNNVANNMALSEEVNGKPDSPEDENDAEYMSESRGEVADGTDDQNDDEEYEHPGEVSIGKKLWNFLTT